MIFPDIEIEVIELPLQLRKNKRSSGEDNILRTENLEKLKKL